jgi:Flp pilus assembly pilin Flp
MTGARRWHFGSERGQTFVEYVMILGLISAIILAVTEIIAPALSTVVVQLITQMSVYMSST